MPGVELTDSQVRHLAVLASDCLAASPCHQCHEIHAALGKDAETELPTTPVDAVRDLKHRMRRLERMLDGGT